MPSNKNDKKPEEAILEGLTPELLLQFAQEDDNDDYEFCIGDKVQLIMDSRGDKVYVIYSYTVYGDGRINYTLWNGDDYEMYERWQIKKYIPLTPIGFIPNETKSNI